MERLKKGEKYWYITVTLNVWSRCEDGDTFGEELAKINNKFHTKEDAEVMARKLRAVLKGADVYTLEEITEIKANAFADGMEAEQRKSKIVK